MDILIPDSNHEVDGGIVAVASLAEVLRVRLKEYSTIRIVFTLDDVTKTISQIQWNETPILGGTHDTILIGTDFNTASSKLLMCRTGQAAVSILTVTGLVDVQLVLSVEDAAEGSLQIQASGACNCHAKAAVK